MRLVKRLLFLAGSVVLFLSSLLAQPTFPARGFAPILNEFQSNKRVESFRKSFFPPLKNQVFHQGYLFRFQFAHYPNTGRSVIYHGLLSGPYPDAPILRVDLQANPQDSHNQASFLLFRDHNLSQAWKWEKENSVIESLSPADWLLPWMAQINHTPFDILMPFVHWSFKYDKSGRVCGRPAHIFEFLPPQENHFFGHSLKSVRLAIDDVYDAPLRIEHMDGGILPKCTFSLQSFKKIDARWMVKTIDAKDRDSKSRTRYELMAVAHGLDLDPSVFKPSGLSKPIIHTSISLRNL